MFGQLLPNKNKITTVLHSNSRGSNRASKHCRHQNPSWTSDKRGERMKPALRSSPGCTRTSRKFRPLAARSESMANKPADYRLRERDMSHIVSNTACIYSKSAESLAPSNMRVFNALHMHSVPCGHISMAIHESTRYKNVSHIWPTSSNIVHFNI
jgi:hypothetical protein